jgi:hypothetical protein
MDDQQHPPPQAPNYIDRAVHLLPVQEAAQLHARWDTADTIEAEVTSWGFPAVVRPNCVAPSLTPETLTSPDTRHYTVIYTQIQEWHTYTQSVVSRVRIRLLQIKNEMGRIEINIKQRACQDAEHHKQKKPTKEALEDLYQMHPGWVELQLQQQIQDQRRILVDGYLERFDNDLKLISRNIELRKTDLENRGVGNNIPHRGNPPPGGMHPGGPRG